MRSKQLLEKFLKDCTNRSGVCWPEIRQEEIDKLSSLFYAIIEDKWGEDCDHDLPVSINLANRKVECMPYFENIPSHTDATDDDMARIEEILLHNLDEALREIQAHRKIMKTMKK